jgi:hypothetical protein
VVLNAGGALISIGGKTMWIKCEMCLKEYDNQEVLQISKYSDQGTADQGGCYCLNCASEVIEIIGAERMMEIV